MTVGELKEALNQYDDNLEVFTKKTDFVGNIGYIFNVKQDTYGFFGESLPCILLTDQIEDEDR
jgi:hypothetical protein